MRVKLTISYDGTNYCGWQVQPNGVSVQGVLKEALYNLTGKEINLTGSGRTDAGVHAEGQVAHFDVQDCTLPADRFYLALNTLLPPDIRVTDSQLVADDFDACRKAKQKTYKYSLYKSDVELPLKERYAIRVDRGLDVEKLRVATKLFLGEHDFKSYCASGSSIKTTVRTIYDFTVVQQNDDVVFTVTGNGFLYNMVRIMVGAVISFAKGKITKEDIIRSLKGEQRNRNIRTMPAKALTLVKVEYN